MSILEVKNLCKSDLIKDFNLSVDKGEKIVVMSSGKNEKTMLLRMLEGLETPDSGEIISDSKIGMFSQDFHLFSNMNVLENLCIAPVKIKGVRRRNAETKAKEWLSKSGLLTKIKEMPENLSEGQRQRISICRSLMIEPEIMLFDALENLKDPNVTSEVSAMIKMLAKTDLTIIVASNDVNFANAVADKVIFISDGKIYEEGSPKEIFNNPKLEKTIEFVRKLKCFNCTFDTCDFDLIELQSNIQRFSEKYNIDKNHANKIQVCVEELVYEMLFGSCQYAEKINLALEVSYSDFDSSVIIDLKGKGTKFNPFENENDNNVHLGVTILKKIAKKISYDFKDNTNYLHVVA